MTRRGDGSAGPLPPGRPAALSVAALGVALASLLLASLLASPLPAPATAAETDSFRWLCKPGLPSDPCAGPPGSLLTAEVTATGQAGTFTPAPLIRLRKRVDCFYVYPTVSGQPGPNADLTTAPEIAGIAVQQASRFAPGCRMFAPEYRQYTVPALVGGEVDRAATDTAYRGVKAAWDEYLADHNKGRGVVLIGHSQGTGHLKRLVAETFDRRPNLRKRLVSAVLIGGNVIVAKGRKVGGNFANIPACGRAGQTGCVIAYSGFRSTPPADANFGRVGGALVESGFSPATHEVMCVNPAELDGSGGVLSPYYATEPFPGLYGPMLPKFPDATTPWVTFPALYRATCKRAEGAHWLQVDDISNDADPRPRVGEPLGATWGTHLTELNDATGNLTTVVARQEEAWVRAADRAKRQVLRKKRLARKRALAKKRRIARKKRLAAKKKRLAKKKAKLAKMKRG